MERPPPVLSQQELETLLGRVLQHESTTIREAEEVLRKAMTKPAFICDLFERVQTSPSPQVRQLAAVLMRRRISSHWCKLGKGVQQQLQAALLALLTSEPERLVVRSITSVVSVVARYALPIKAWPELFGFLFQCSQSPNAAHRELSMLLLASLLESELVLDGTFRPHFQLLTSTLNTLLSDEANPPVRRAALKAVGAWVHTLENDESGLIKPLVAPMLDVCRGAAAGAVVDEETLVLGFGILDDLLEAGSSAITPQLGPVVGFALDAALHSRLDVETRGAALHLVACALATKKKTLVKLKLIEPIAAKLFGVLADGSDVEGGHDEDEDEPSVHRFGAQCFHQMADNVPSKHAVPVILSLVRWSPPRTRHAFARAARARARASCAHPG